MARSLVAVVARWAERAGIEPAHWPVPARFQNRFDPGSLRAPTTEARLAAWERRHGFRLPKALRCWLRQSDGLYRDGAPLIHPLAAIGPMVPFAQVPGLVIQPESWFELGNPGTETVCVDLAYSWPGGDCPIFTSGDDQRQTRPRLIAAGFAPWLVQLLNEGGRGFWLDPEHASLGDPWQEHRRHAPPPPLPDRLRPLAERIAPLLHAGADDRVIASTLGISWWDVETLVRHLQHH